MSTATASPTPPTSHIPRTAHSLPLKEQAFTLHCHGLRSPAIAAELGVPERTIRSWIAAALDDLKDDLQINRRQQLLLAVERQNAVTAAAWRQFEAETAARDALLDALLDACQHPVASDAAGSSPSTATSTLPRLPATVPAPRYLSLILQANKETNRLLGLYTLAKLRLLTPEAEDASSIPPSAPDIAAESATTSSPDSDMPAESATAISPLSQGSPRDDVGAHVVRPDYPAMTSSAESATAPYDRDTAAESATATPAGSSPFLAFRHVTHAPALKGRDPSIPAKTATAPSSRYPAQRARHSRPAPTAPKPWMM